MCSGKRPRQSNINTGHMAGDGEVVTRALNIKIPHGMTAMLDGMTDDKFESLYIDVMAVRQASKLMAVFEGEIAIISEVEDCCPFNAGGLSNNPNR